ncbi:MAG TPA: cytochrome c oxidase subunit II [Stellaceae bacterium]|nr:cytochrome c oxidase subunit II [Stellaceae bacterium]
MQWLPFWPPDASNTAASIDKIFIGELSLSLVILCFVFGMMIVFGVRYRRNSAADRSNLVKKTWHWELTWTTGSLAVFLALFVWGANMYLWLYEPPRHPGLEIYVVAKQWMWKAEHPGGQREINEVHLPVDKVVRLLLTSEDVIHDFFVPAFRVKHDVLPGQYQTLWFKPTETGRFRLECAQYCGTQHAHMIGDIVVQSQADYARWLSQQGVHKSLAQQGEQLFRSFGCSGCHGANSTVHAPSLTGLYGRVVHLQDGTTTTADERYLRDCILLGASHIQVAGYPPIMPSFAGQIGEDDLMKLVAYIQSLSRQQQASP